MSLITVPPYIGVRFDNYSARLCTTRPDEYIVDCSKFEPIMCCDSINTLDLERIKHEFRNCNDPIEKIRMTKKLLKIRNELDALITWG